MDNETLEKLILANEQTLYRISMSILKNEEDAMDAVHDAIVKAYEKSNTLRNEEYFSTWLVRILIRCCYRQLKHNSRFADTGETMPEIASRNNPYLHIELGEIIDKLPPKIRDVIILFYAEGYSIKEIKQILHIPEGTVKSRLAKGRSIIKKELKG